MISLDAIGARLEELIREGKQWTMRPSRENEYFLDPNSHGWLTSAANLVSMVTLERGSYYDQVTTLLENGNLGRGVVKNIVEQMVGILVALQADWTRGLLRRIEYLVAAETFDSFLDHAEGYHRGGHVLESGVLVSIVFEDAIRKFVKKLGLNMNAEIEQLIDDIAKRDAITSVMARRLKGGPAALRNKALHAKWNEFDLKDVGGRRVQRQQRGPRPAPLLPGEGVG